jgi:hypothetical protein
MIRSVLALACLAAIATAAPVNDDAGLTARLAPGATAAVAASAVVCRLQLPAPGVRGASHRIAVPLLTQPPPPPTELIAPVRRRQLPAPGSLVHRLAPPPAATSSLRRGPWGIASPRRPRLRPLLTQVEITREVSIFAAKGEPPGGGGSGAGGVRAMGCPDGPRRRELEAAYHGGGGDGGGGGGGGGERRRRRRQTARWGLALM